MRTGTLRIIGAGRMELDGACAMSSATDFETYARDCVKLAEQAHTPPELREQLLQMAREWMQAMMEAEDGTCRSPVLYRPVWQPAPPGRDADRRSDGLPSREIVPCKKCLRTGRPKQIINGRRFTP